MSETRRCVGASISHVPEVFGDRACAGLAGIGERQVYIRAGGIRAPETGLGLIINAGE